MDAELKKLPRKVQREILSIIDELLETGWQLDFVRYDERSFGNWYVDLVRSALEIRVVKDRSQYRVTGPSFNELEKSGLERTFDDLDQFRQALNGWATAQR